jgi:organic radical activating enzyme
MQTEHKIELIKPSLPLSELYFKIKSRVKRLLFPSVSLTSDGKKVKIRYFQVYLANGCNFKCIGCSHFNPMRKGITTRQEMCQWYEAWSQKLVPDEVGVLGGEPLLNKDFANILRDTRKFWRNARISVYTNGVLLHRLDDTVFQAMRDVNAIIHISEHTQDESYVTFINDGIRRLQSENIKVMVIPSLKHWRYPYKIDSKGQPYPYKSSPALAWKICEPKNCVALVNNQLYKCSYIVSMADAYREGVLGEEWKAALDYQPLTPDCSAEEIIAHLSAHEVSQCSMCPEQFEIMSVEDAQRYNVHKSQLERKAG